MKDSGYTYCGCRDCFEIVVSSDMASPDLCDDCAEAGCDGGECDAAGASGGGDETAHYR